MSSLLFLDKKSHNSTLEGALSRQIYVMDDICLIGTQGKQTATKTTRQDSLFTGKHREIAMRSETCVELTKVEFLMQVKSFSS